MNQVVKKIVCGAVGACLLSLLGGSQLFAQKPADKKPAPASLDEQLLKDLPSDLLEGLDDKPADKAPPAKEPSAKKAEPAKRPALDEQLLEGLDGEDIGESGNPLINIGRKMKTVEELLGKSGENPEELQKQIVGDLDHLIQELKKKQKKQQQSSSGGSGSKQAQRGGVQPPDRNSPPGNSGQSNSGPARESTANLQNRKAEHADFGELKKQLKDLWGDLPEKDREQLLSSEGGKFLPKYELLIEKYFRRLGEQPPASP